MSTKNSRSYSSSIPTIWKRVPNRIKGFLKRDTFDPTSPPPPTSAKSKSSLIHRIFPSAAASATTTATSTSPTKKKQGRVQLKKSQWSNNSNSDFHDIEMYNSEVPLRANLMSFFTSTSVKDQQIGWSNFLSTPTDKLDFISRTYIGTLGKLRLISHYTMEQQISIHHILACIQQRTVTQQQDKKRKKSHHSHHQHNHHSHFAGQNNSSNSLLTISQRSSITDSILMNNRKPRRTRYIFMLLSTPVSQVINKLHPVTEAVSKLRKPYADTFAVITSAKVVKQQQQQAAIVTVKKTKSKGVVATFKFVPADYLLHPATLRGQCPSVEVEKQQQDNNKDRLGTKFGVTTTNQKQQAESQQQQQQQQQKVDLFINTSTSATATMKQVVVTDVESPLTPIMATIQIQTN